MCVHVCVYVSEYECVVCVILCVGFVCLYGVPILFS